MKLYLKLVDTPYGKAPALCTEDGTVIEGQLSVDVSASVAQQTATVSLEVEEWVEEGE